MPRYLIEVPHKNSKNACDQVVVTFRNTGSHFLTNADFGCHDDVHKAWMIVEVDSKREAKNIVPPAYREKTKVVMIEKLALDNIDKHKKHHKD